MSPNADAYLAGIRLFNDHEFWHAHEAWETCWLAASEPDATFYKGIIQAAAALVKWQQGNQRGLRLNWAKSRAKLEGLPSPYHGIDLTRLLHDMESFVTQTEHGNAPSVPRIAQ